MGRENGCGIAVGKETPAAAAATAKFAAFNIVWAGKGDFNTGVIISLFPDKVFVIGGVTVLKSLLLPPLGLSLFDLLPPKDGSVYFLACLACLFSWYL